jgi:3-hydroxyisobutyrate dehydrogenase-like beta-hydroxyacid dehydrogenase
MTMQRNEGSAMKIEKVGLMTPGDMGQGIAIQIKAKGFPVLTALDKRSERSRTLAREAGLTDVGTLEHLVSECDVILSVINPGAAVDFARDVAAALRSTGRHILIVDCNAIAPDTVHEVARIIEAAGGRFLDGGIIGPPPRGKARANLFVSGPGAKDLEAIGGPQLVMQVVSERLGDASAVKMCYAALNKGTQALWLEVLMAAQRLGVAELVDQQLRQSRADLLDWAYSQYPKMPPKAYRWVPEMLEIAKTLGSAGITTKVFEGAAEIYRFVAGTTLGKETPEQSRANERSGQQVVQSLAEERKPVH